MTQARREQALLERIRREWKAVKEAEQELHEAGKVYQAKKERFRDAMHRVRRSEALLSAELQGVDTEKGLGSRDSGLGEGTKKS